MEQRSLRLGDIVDDYCPRERRITNHAIVAIVEDAIRQTRCTTCDHEHEFKQAREPRRRKTSVPSLYEEVLADVAGAQLVPPQREAAETAAPMVEARGADADAVVPSDVAASSSTPDDAAWPAHRTLIRATLPRVDGEPPPPRPIPEFTMHQRPPQPRGRSGFRVHHGPQNEGFGNSRDGRSGRGPQGNGWGSGSRNGNVDDSQGNGNAPKRRGRRRRGKRAR